MVRAVVLSSHVTVQGVYVRTLSDGRVVVRVGQRQYAGTPVEDYGKAA